jgi:predicted DNA binding CopG/RHH family protein
MKRTYKQKKTNVISIRVSDEEMEGIQQVIAATNMRASQVMREAFQLMAKQWLQENPASACH